MKPFAHLLALSLALQGAGAGATPFFHSTNDVGMMLEPRANGNPPTYQQVLAASLRRYPGMQSGSHSGRLRYSLKPCNDRCERKNEVQDKDGNCKPCPTGQKPDRDQSKCLPDGKEQGTCESGKILDPAAGGQDANTKNPRCITDDDEKCPEGQRAESRRKGRDVDEASYQPNCAADEDPGFKCGDSNTYDHKTIQDGRIRHSCRSTRKHEDDKKSSYDKRVQESRDAKGKNAQNLDRERRQKNRSGWCFVALASMGLFDYMGEEINSLSDDEIDGMYAQYPSDAPDPSGDGSIPNWVVAKYATVTGIVSEDAGFGGIFQAIAKFVGAGKGSTASSVAVKGIRSGKARGPSSAARRAGSKSGTIQKVFKDKNMLDCVSTIASSAAGLVRRADVVKFSNGPIGLDIDWSRTEEMSRSPPEGVSIELRYDDHEDRLNRVVTTRNPAEVYYSPRRMSYETCQAPEIINGIVSLRVTGGCCAFYDGDDCAHDTFMFAMENREHGDLQGAHRSAINSYWCTAKAGCEGQP